MEIPNPLLCLVLEMISNQSFKPNGRQPGRLRRLSPDSDFYSKSGMLEGINELAEVIRFLKRWTNIPLPCIAVNATGLFNHYMIMERIEGLPLDVLWNEMKKHKAKIVRQLRDIIAQHVRFHHQTRVQFQDSMADNAWTHELRAWYRSGLSRMKPRSTTS